MAKKTTYETDEDLDRTVAAVHQDKGEARKMMASLIAGGLLAAHGIDAGGATPQYIAKKALAIADAIVKEVDSPEDDGEGKWVTT
jgi:hypothetical protein